MISRILALFFAVGLAAAVAAGCTTAEQGTPEPAAGKNQSNSSGSGSGSSNGAPRVKSPIDAAHYVTAPCRSLTSAQATALGATQSGKPNTTSDSAELDGPSCIWHNHDDLTSFSIGFLTGNENGLADLYLGKKQGDFEYFEPTVVDDYPAVYASGVDLREEGHCTLNVGISDKLHITIVIQSEKDKADSCGAARDVASAALKTMKGGG